MKKIGLKFDLSDGFEELAALDAEIAQAMAVIAALPASVSPFQAAFHTFQPIERKNDSDTGNEG